MALLRSRTRAAAFLALGVLGTALPGCLHGWLYENYTVPVVTDMRNTPRGTRKAELNSVHVQVPYTDDLVNLELFSRAIGDAARAQGLKVIYFADQHTESWFGDLFRRDTIEVWGE